VTVFADSSALAKRYLDEPGSDEVRAIPGRLAISALALVEVASAIWRKSREGTIEPYEASVLHADLDADRAHRYAIVAPTSRVLADAASLVARHPLRTLDAIQLSSALAVQRAQPEPVTFATFDRALARVALVERLEVLPAGR
jgi:predicted nucleic acid-binding protein